MPVCASEAAKGRDKAGEDADENDVGAESTDHVDEAEETHPELEKACVEQTKSASDLEYCDEQESLPKLALKAGFSAPVV